MLSCQRVERKNSKEEWQFVSDQYIFECKVPDDDEGQQKRLQNSSNWRFYTGSLIRIRFIPDMPPVYSQFQPWDFCSL